MNAFVGPKTSLYLNNLQNKLSDSGFRANLRVIGSNWRYRHCRNLLAEGGHRIPMSGPACGAIGGRAEGMLCGRSNLCDSPSTSAGTSADISTIPDGRIKIMNARDSYVTGHPILVPMIDLVPIPVPAADRSPISMLPAAFTSVRARPAPIPARPVTVKAGRSRRSPTPGRSRPP